MKSSRYLETCSAILETRRTTSPLASQSSSHLPLRSFLDSRNARYCDRHQYYRRAYLIDQQRHLPICYMFSRVILLRFEAKSTEQSSYEMRGISISKDLSSGSFHTKSHTTLHEKLRRSCSDSVTLDNQACRSCPIPPSCQILTRILPQVQIPQTLRAVQDGSTTNDHTWTPSHTVSLLKSMAMRQHFFRYFQARLQLRRGRAALPFIGKPSHGSRVFCL